MFIRRRRGWEIPESEATPESVYQGRRRFMIGAGAVTIGGSLLAACDEGAGQAKAAVDPGEFPGKDGLYPDLYPPKRNETFTLDRDLSASQDALTYNNFYEFGSQKNIWEGAQDLPLEPWTVKIDGMVEQEKTVDFEEIVRAMPLEERLYRHRCVEAWAMAVPWDGFPLAALVDYARPLGSAKYLRMETFQNPDVASGQRQFWYPWPYIEGLRLDEAKNDLAFIATGMYGKPIKRQNGAPLRLVTPWKYGFKSIKSLVRLTFTEEQPVGYWEQLQSKEYGFWANVNPEVPHRRWSQASERLLGSDERVPTQLYNGYGEYVASLYEGMDPKKLYY